jgi:repressor LexA
MIGDGILSGDYVFVRKQLSADDGDVVVALIGDEATVKRVYFEGDRIRFQPSNPRMAPIYVRKEDFKSTMILGIVVGLYRRMT